MSFLSVRQQKIIQCFMRDQSILKGKQLAEELNLSLRSLQAEIANINRSFPNKLILSSNRGYQLDKDVWSTCDVQFEEMPEDDLLPVLKKLVLEEKKWQIEELGEACFLSTSALASRLKTIQKQVKDHQLTLARKKNHIWIEGAEYDKRRFIHFLILQEFDPALISLENCARYFSDMDMMYMNTIITSTIQKYNCHIEDSYAPNVYLTITIALSRMRKKHNMDCLDSSNINYESIEYLIASEICKQYARHYALHVYPEDIIHITTLILGQVKPITVLHSSEVISTVSETFRQDISNILMKTFHYYMLNIDYKPFLKNFILHVDALITRSKHNQYVSNAIAENIKSSCPFIYDVAVHLAKEIEEKYHVNISDEEIGFISIHIGFAIENNTKEHHLIKVLLICNDYHQTASHILTRLKENYESLIEITNVISSFQSLPYQSSDDLIISTVPMDLVGRKVILISPFYTMMDQIAVDDAMKDCRREMEAKREKQLLISYFDEALFFIRDDLGNKEEVIQFLGKQIEHVGLAESGFVDSVLKREQMSSTCFFETFAIPHAIELNAKKTMFCVLINRKGIQWDRHHIKIVLMIAVQQKDRKEFMKIYNSVIHVLWNKEKLGRLIDSESFPAFIENLKLDLH